MYRMLASLMAVVIGAALMAGSTDAQEGDARQRFSIAISGGASKGAYEAGLNWAAIKAMRETEDLKSLSGGRFRTWEFASAAGASAGRRAGTRPRCATTPDHTAQREGENRQNKGPPPLTTPCTSSNKEERESPRLR